MDDDLTDEELEAASKLYETLNHANKHAYVDGELLHTVKLMHRMAEEILRRRKATKRYFAEISDHG